MYATYLLTKYIIFLKNLTKFGQNRSFNMRLLRCKDCKVKNRIITYSIIQSEISYSNMTHRTGVISLVHLVNESGSKLYEVPRHMVTIHASQEDIVAKHDPQRSSIFISSLCTVLNKYPAEELVSHMKIDTGQDRKIIYVISAIRVLKPVAKVW